jgi:hypothetical protein
MHEMNNTLGGRYGFVVVYPDGTRITEFDAVWDEIPMTIPIRSLGLYDSVKQEMILELSNYDVFFFSNEAISGRAFDVPGFHNGTYTPPPDFMLVAKIIGGFDKHNGVVEVRVDLSRGVPRGEKRSYAAPQCPFAPHACRPGAL